MKTFYHVQRPSSGAHHGEPRITSVGLMPFYRALSLLIVLCTLTDCIYVYGEATTIGSNKATFVNVVTGDAYDLGKIDAIRGQVVNGCFNVTLTFTSKVMLQLNGIPCDGDLKSGSYSGKQFRAVLMHTPWGEEALVGADETNRLMVAHHGQTKAEISFSVIFKGFGRKIHATGSFDTDRRFTPEQISTNSR